MSAIEAYVSLSQATGVELRSILALARIDRLDLLFDSGGVLIRAHDANSYIARRRMRDVARRWEQRGDPLPERPACPVCGDIYDADRRCHCTRPRRY
jgi:hypothetical protein